METLLGRSRTVLQGKTDLTPAALIEAWKSLGEYIKDGYDDNIYEYENDLTVRNHIELLLEDPIFRSIEGYEDFKNRILEVDEAFKACSTLDVRKPNRKEWWRRSVPKAAGEELAQEIKDEYGLTIEIKNG